MTVEAHAADRHVPARTPAGVRVALQGADRAEFEREYRAAITRAGRDFDLAPVHELVERWWRVAVLAADPVANQRMLQTVAALRSGCAVPSTPWRQA